MSESRNSQPRSRHVISLCSENIFDPLARLSLLGRARRAIALFEGIRLLRIKLLTQNIKSCTCCGQMSKERYDHTLKFIVLKAFRLE